MINKVVHSVKLVIQNGISECGKQNITIFDHIQNEDNETVYFFIDFRFPLF